jgi:uncharacterized membrane protein
MTKRRIKANQLEFLQRELRHWEETGMLSADKASELEGLYEIRTVSFTKTLLYAGAILIGAGILSLIASNWGEIGKLAKYLFILGMFIGCNAAGYRLERNFPKTAKSFFYLGVLVFGAGIFLIGQMFHFGGDFEDAFLWWSLGILPLAWFLRDKWILLASSLFTLIYMTNGQYLGGDEVPYWIVLWIAAIYFLNKKIGFLPLTGFVNGVLVLTFIAAILNAVLDGVNSTAYIYGLIYLLIGAGLIIKREKIHSVYILLGHIVHGGAALFLSFGESWPADWIYLPFSILYILFILFLIKGGSLYSIIILCVMIFRFYLDLTFDFMPKSLVFIIGGLLLLGFGFYFEKQRKKGGGIHA